LLLEKTDKKKPEFRVLADLEAPFRRRLIRRSFNLVLAASAPGRSLAPAIATDRGRAAAVKLDRTTSGARPLQIDDILLLQKPIP